MDFFSFFKKEKEELALVYDIGSSSVGGAIVLYSEQKIPKIIYNVRREIAFQDELDKRRLESLIYDAVNKVSLDLEKNGLTHLKFTKFGNRNPKKVFASLSSPWYVSQTRVIKLKKENFLVDEKLVDDLVEKEISLFKNSEISKKYVGEDEVLIVEKRIVRIKLNGYETAEPYGKMAQELEIDIVVGISPKKILENITNAYKKVFNIDSLQFGVFPMLSFLTIRDISYKNADFMFIDISGEVTDVLVSKQGIPIRVHSFPVGKNTLLRYASKKLGTSKDEVLSLITLYNDGIMHSSQIEKNKDVLKEIQDKWVSSFGSSLNKISEDLSIPSNVFFTADNDLLGWFEVLIAKEQFGQFTMTDKPFNVVSIDASFLSKNINTNMKNSSHYDPFLMIISIFFGRII